MDFRGDENESKKEDIVKIVFLKLVLKSLKPKRISWNPYLGSVALHLSKQ